MSKKKLNLVMKKQNSVVTKSEKENLFMELIKLYLIVLRDRGDLSAEEYTHICRMDNVLCL